MAGCIDGGRHLLALFSLPAHGLRFGLADRKSERRERGKDHCIILSNPADNRRTIPPSLAHSIPLKLSTSSSFPLRPSTLPVRGVPFFSPFSFFYWICTMSPVMAASERKRFSVTRGIAVKNKFNSSAASTHPCLRPCSTSSLYEQLPSSNHTNACMPSCNWRITASILGGTPNRARASNGRDRSTET